MSSSNASTKFYLHVYMFLSVLGVILGNLDQDSMLIRVYSDIVHCRFSNVGMSILMVLIMFLGFYGIIADSGCNKGIFNLSHMVFLVIRIVLTVQIWQDLKSGSDPEDAPQALLEIMGRDDMGSFRTREFFAVLAYVFASIFTLCAILFICALGASRDEEDAADLSEIIGRVMSPQPVVNNVVVVK